MFFVWHVGRLILWTVSHVLLSCVNFERSLTVYEAKILEQEMRRGVGKDSIYLHLSQKYALFCLFVMFFYYIRQVNGVKLADVLFSLLCVCVCVCAPSVQASWRIYALSEYLLVIFVVL